MRLANVLNKQGKFVQCAQIYYSLLKLDNKEKNTQVVDALVNILIETNEIFESCVYIDLFSFLNETNDVKIDKKQMEMLHEKYLQAKIKEKHDWNEIEKDMFIYY
jgi:uncharacterized protein YggL (DUF469 family)